MGIVSDAPNFCVVLGNPFDNIELCEFMNKRTLTLGEKVGILKDVAQGLLHCHSHNKVVGCLTNYSVLVSVTIFIIYHGFTKIHLFSH